MTLDTTMFTNKRRRSLWHRPDFGRGSAEYHSASVAPGTVGVAAYTGRAPRKEEAHGRTEHYASFDK